MGNVARSESVTDLNAELSMLTFAGARTPRTDPIDLNGKAFGIGNVSRLVTISYSTCVKYLGVIFFTNKKLLFPFN